MTMQKKAQRFIGLRSQFFLVQMKDECTAFHTLEAPI